MSDHYGVGGHLKHYLSYQVKSGRRFSYRTFESELFDAGFEDLDSEEIDAAWNYYNALINS